MNGRVVACMRLTPRCFDFAQHDKEEWMLLRIVILNVVKNLADRRNKLLQKSL